MLIETEEDLRKIYAESKTVAVVGISSDENKAAHVIPRYLQQEGYRIIPVSPKGGELLGETVHESLDSVEADVDVVDVFRPSEEAADVAKQAVAIGAKVIWLQEGVRSEEAVRIADEAGIKIVQDRCMGATHQMLGLGPGPWA